MLPWLGRGFGFDSRPVHNLLNAGVLKMENCIFCKIVKGEIPSFKIWENKEFIAILDIQPNCYGQTLVISKEHRQSNTVYEDEEFFARHFLAAKEVAKLLNEKLGTKRTAIVLEGMGINHAHLKLYPMHGLSDKFEAFESGERVYFNKYPGFVTSQLGPKKSSEELLEIMKKLK